MIKFSSFGTACKIDWTWHGTIFRNVYLYFCSFHPHWRSNKHFTQGEVLVVYRHNMKIKGSTTPSCFKSNQRPMYSLKFITTTKTDVFYQIIILTHCKCNCANVYEWWIIFPSFYFTLECTWKSPTGYFLCIERGYNNILARRYLNLFFLLNSLELLDMPTMYSIERMRYSKRQQTKIYWSCFFTDVHW